MSNITKRNDLFPSFNSIFDDFFKDDLFNWGTGRGLSIGTSMPAVNIRETETGFHLEVAVPGANKDDLNVHMENGMLTISSEKEDSKEETGENYTRKEFSYSSFKRSFRVPEKDIDAAKIQARYDNGVLHVDLPKKDEVVKNPAKKIQIS